MDIIFQTYIRKNFNFITPISPFKEIDYKPYYFKDFESAQHFAHGISIGLRCKYKYPKVAMYEKKDNGELTLLSVYG